MQDTESEKKNEQNQEPGTGDNAQWFTVVDAPTWELTTFCKYSFRDSNTLFWSPWALSMYLTHVQM